MSARRWRRIAAALTAAGLTVVLAACAGLPVSGPVKLGRTVAEAGEEPAVSFNPDEPIPGMTPQQVVEGFIDAGTGPRNDWGTARLFLTDDSDWNPSAGVTVYTPGQRAVVETAEGEVTVSVTQEASVDDIGAYATASGQPIALTYRLEQVAGEWRISEAPDGIVLDRNRFSSVYRAYSLMFFDPSWTYLVPDQRWFTVEYAPVRIAEALVAGPSPWLLDSVATAFSENVGLSGPFVPVRSQTAEVSLRPPARDLDQLTLDRMQTQLEQSLASAGVRDVDLLVDGQALDASIVPVRSTRVDARALVLSGSSLGFLSGAEVEPLASFAQAFGDVAPDAVEIDADRAVAAVRTSAGEVRRVLADSRWESLDARAGLLAPTVDAAGYIYSVPAGDPSALLAFGPDGDTFEVADAWPGATEAYAVRVSRDGTRIAALMRDGTQPTIMVAGIVRDDAGAPVRLSEQYSLGALPGEGIDLAWLDGSTLAALAEAEGGRVVVEQEVGGPSASTRAPAGGVAIAGGNEPGAVRLLDRDGELYGQRGATWSPLASEISVLVVQQGSPG
ncbi:LpqB family beta-propeller domain-containing protein [Microbacterium sp. T2.11-28]|uniref:LpqB family beta-propeller domain-containing protein n=1 Tax=unclassified Microbacterium TaxID=2609290 RepID=UPI002477948D|nr:LpqB family beta-propeller domain-containing protein [Microbacterium sp. T2.11-28]CAI9392839.1 Lipoprotein LpqB [Microbacterium sp. T2.11-28]